MDLKDLLVPVPEDDSVQHPVEEDGLMSDASRRAFDPLLSRRVEAAVRVEKARGTRYQLYAVVKHRGETPRHGHYFSFVRQRDPDVADREVYRWYRYDDLGGLAAETADLATAEGKAQEKTFFDTHVSKGGGLFWRRMRNEEVAVDEEDEDLIEGEGEAMDVDVEA